MRERTTARSYAAVAENEIRENTDTGSRIVTWNGRTFPWVRSQEKVARFDSSAAGNDRFASESPGFSAGVMFA